MSIIGRNQAAAGDDVDRDVTRLGHQTTCMIECQTQTISNEILGIAYALSPAWCARAIQYSL